MADNSPNATLAARCADLRAMLDTGDDHFEGIDKDDALRELLDLLDNARVFFAADWALLDNGEIVERFVFEDDARQAVLDPANEHLEVAYIADPNPLGDLADA